MRFLRRRRGWAAMTAALLLVPAALAGDTMWQNSADAKQLGPLANGLGRGLFGIELEDLGASGQLPEVDRLSDELMRLAGDPDALASAGDTLSVPGADLGIPGPAAAAYRKAADLLAVQQPNCHMHWSLLASIGRIESGHGNQGRTNSKGDTIDRILGPVLNGGAFAAIGDTDRGVLDGDTTWDRAVGPMQFIPSTWQAYAADGNGDGVRSPHNFYDAALAAGKYLCSGGLDMSNPQQRGVAVFRYNHSETYVRTVLIWADAYATGMTTIPAGTGTTYPDTQAIYNPPAGTTTPVPAPTPTPTPTPPPPSSNPPSSTPPRTSSAVTIPPPTTTLPSTPPSAEPPDPPDTTTSSVPPTTTSAPPPAGEQTPQSTPRPSSAGSGGAQPSGTP